MKLQWHLCPHLLPLLIGRMKTGRSKIYKRFMNAVQWLLSICSIKGPVCWIVVHIISAMTRAGLRCSALSKNSAKRTEVKEKRWSKWSRSSGKQQIHFPRAAADFQQWKKLTGLASLDFAMGKYFGTWLPVTPISSAVKTPCSSPQAENYLENSSSTF